ncbi:MAG: protein kinase [Gemmatimonadaceae bacterium]
MDDVVARLTAALAGRYAIEREVGRGGMATVFLAEDVKHHRPVAVKVLHPELASAIGAGRFLREIEIGARLQHPHILTLIDSGEADGFLYYVMPFVDGASLRARLVHEHELPLADALRILREVADALAEAHAQGVVHRDIKPDNVLLRGQHAVVTDFGVAKAVSEATDHQQLTTVGLTLGTPAYMAPEQAAGDPTTDHRADIYALGVLAYEMLAGQPPFTGATPQAVLAAHMTHVPAPIITHRATVPAPVAELVMRCLEKKPADRWQSANEILRQLDAISTSGIGTPQLTAAQSRASARSWRVPRVAALLGGLAVVALLAYGLLSGRVGGRSEAHRIPTLAVLPFENLGPADDEYFADGMTEELTGRLAKLSGLLVIARTSAIHYKKTTKSVQAIAQELGADFLIEGTVRWEKGADGAGRVRIAPQLIQAKNGTHLWAERFDKPYGGGIFEIQSEIAERVAEALDVRLLTTEQHAVRDVPTRNLQAYDAFLRGQAYAGRDLGQDWEAERLAFEQFEKAVQLDPNFALAHAWLASAHLKTRTSGYDISLPTGVSSQQRLALARASAERALAISPDLPLAHASLAFYHLFKISSDTARFREELGIALRGNPSDAQTHADRGTWFLRTGNGDAGMQDLQTALALDPRNPRRLIDIARASMDLAKYRPAEDYLDRAIALEPRQPTVHLHKAWLYLMQGRVEQARAAVRTGIHQAGVTAVLFRMSQNSQWIRMLQILHDDLAPAARQLTWDVFGADSADYYLVKAYANLNNPVRARSYYDSLAAWAAPRARRGDVYPVFHIVWAYGLAGSGKRTAALTEMRRVLADKRYGWRPIAHEQAAEACVLVGEYDRAIDQIRAALVSPEILTPALLRVEPIWDPLRGRADFRKLSEQP